MEVIIHILKLVKSKQSRICTYLMIFSLGTGSGSSKKPTGLPASETGSQDQLSAPSSPAKSVPSAALAQGNYSDSKNLSNESQPLPICTNLTIFPQTVLHPQQQQQQQQRRPETNLLNRKSGNFLGLQSYLVRNLLLNWNLPNSLRLSKPRSLQ